MTIKKPYFPWQTAKEWRKSFPTNKWIPCGTHVFGSHIVGPYPCNKCGGNGYILTCITQPKPYHSGINHTKCETCSGSGQISQEEFEVAFQVAREQFVVDLGRYFDLLKEQTLILSKLSRSEIEFLRKWGVDHE